MATTISHGTHSLPNQVMASAIPRHDVFFYVRSYYLRCDYVSIHASE